MTDGTKVTDVLTIYFDINMRTAGQKFEKYNFIFSVEFHGDYDKIKS